MQTKVNRLDALDVEAFEKMLSSDSFSLFKQRVEVELGRAQNDCETASIDHEIRRAQGATKALRTVLKLPAMILESMKKPGEV